CATILAGVILAAMGLCGLGSLIRYVPYPVTLGFTSGIAVVIAASQLQMFFGIDLGEDKLPGQFIAKMQVLFTHADSINWYACALAISTVVIIFLTDKWTKNRIPGSLLAVVLGTILVSAFHIPVDTIGQPVGKEPISLALSFPGFSFPNFDLTKIKLILSAALTIAMLGAIESLLSAVVADEMINTKHNSNTELIAQGIANIVTPFFGGIPSTGAIARTATNIRSGGRTPIAGIVHAVTLFLIVLYLGNYAAMIPMPVLAGILMVVAIRMSQYSLLLKMFLAPKSDIAVLWITLLLTVFFDLTIAIPVGLILASFLFMRRMEMLFVTGNITNRFFRVEEGFDSNESIFGSFPRNFGDIPEGMQAFDVRGPFFFGTVGKFQEAIDDQNVPVLILRMKHVPAMDVTGLNVLEDLLIRARLGNTVILFSSLQSQPLRVIRQFGLHKKIGEENIHKSVDDAVSHAIQIVKKSQQQNTDTTNKPEEMTNVFIQASS
ncbi:MAG: SulP family inorganic anion transporter, partial [Thermoguttaceae bacterium]